MHQSKQQTTNNNAHSGRKASDDTAVLITYFAYVVLSEICIAIFGKLLFDYVVFTKLVLITVQIIIMSGNLLFWRKPEDGGRISPRNILCLLYWNTFGGKAP